MLFEAFEPPPLLVTLELVEMEEVMTFCSGVEFKLKESEGFVGELIVLGLDGSFLTLMFQSPNSVSSLARGDVNGDDEVLDMEFIAAASQKVIKIMQTSYAMLNKKHYCILLSLDLAYIL